MIFLSPDTTDSVNSLIYPVTSGKSIGSLRTNTVAQENPSVHPKRFFYPSKTKSRRRNVN